MGALSDYVSLTITSDSVGIARAGFGVPLILSATASFAERSREYTDLAGVIADGFTTYTPEYRAASTLFSQSPHPSKIRIGRSANKPTLVYTLSVATVRNSHAYSIKVKFNDQAEATATYTSDASATDAEIAAGLVSALNALTGNNYTASGSSSPFTVTGDAAGEWFSLEVNSVSDLSISMTHADPGVAADLAAINLENPNWYALYTLYNSNAYALAAAAWIETQKKIYLLDCNESAAITTAAGNSDTLDDIATLGYARTAGMYHPAPDQMAGAAWLGNCLPRDVGSETWAFKKLAGVSTVNLSSTQRSNLVSRNANSYESVSGVSVTFLGTTADGDYIDVQRGLDWIDDDMSKGVMEILAGAAKIPYTDAGVAMIVAGVRATLRRAVERSILADDPAFTVTFPKVADVSAGNKSARLLPDVKFSATLAGAIHKVNISGVVSV